VRQRRGVFERHRPQRKRDIDDGSFLEPSIDIPLVECSHDDGVLWGDPCPESPNTVIEGGLEDEV